MTTLLAVAAGGALGALGRYLVMSRVGHWLGSDFPFATLTVNLAGSFALGLIVGLGTRLWAPSPEIEGFLAVGLLGGFTTVSTFALDVAFLWDRRQTARAGLYCLASVALSIAALAAGLALSGGLP
jgi:CrcB protein